MNFQNSSPHASSFHLLTHHLRSINPSSEAPDQANRLVKSAAHARGEMQEANRLFSTFRQRHDWSKGNNVVEMTLVCSNLHPLRLCVETCLLIRELRLDASLMMPPENRQMEGEKTERGRLGEWEALGGKGLGLQ